MCGPGILCNKQSKLQSLHKAKQLSFSSLQNEPCICPWFACILCWVVPVVSCLYTNVYIRSSSCTNAVQYVWLLCKYISIIFFTSHMLYIKYITINECDSASHMLYFFIFHKVCIRFCHLSLLSGFLFQHAEGMNGLCWECLFCVAQTQEY